MIPYGKHEITSEDINEVIKVLKSDFITQGTTTPKFERRLSKYCNVNHVVAVNSCTSALHIACRALGLGQGDILWTSPISFVASANCAIYCGASVDFVDIDPDTALMSVEHLEEKLKKAKLMKKLPKIVIPVHFSGQSCDMKSISLLGKKYGFSIIEDAAHAMGARYDNAPVGCCLYSDITVFSFHPVKIITTAEGGAAMTNCDDLNRKMMIYRSHGIVRNFSNDKRLSWMYEQVDIGYNYRMPDINAALGLSQLNRLNGYVSKRVEIANWYDQNFTDDNVVPLFKNIDTTQSSHHLYVLRIMDGESKRNELFAYLRSSGIGVNVHYMPIYKHPFFKKLGVRLENAENYFSSAISLPIFPNINRSDSYKIVDKVSEFFKG
jgi:UDP-4-amino-4,6-dideoxy-N-acetyl-beta-L-altrosamine transaminase